VKRFTTSCKPAKARAAQDRKWRLPAAHMLCTIVRRSGMPLLTAGWLLLALWAAAPNVTAAELRLRKQCEVLRPIVTLGDVAEVLATTDREAARLQAVELFPSPLPGQTRYLTVRELQDALLLRGVDLVAVRMTGAAQVAIHRAEAPAQLYPATTGDRPGGWQRRIAEAIEQYVRQRHSWQGALQVGVSLGPDQLSRLTTADRVMEVSGGRPPWRGVQQFHVTVGTDHGPLVLTVTAQVEIVPPLLVAARALPQGTILQASDVRLATVPASEMPGDACRAVEEVIGAEVVRPIAEGDVIRSSAIRPPILVRRGDAVTVTARAAGVRVRMVAKARANGALGQLVQLESPLDGSVFVARVTGLREAEVLARATSTSPPEAIGQRRTTIGAASAPGENPASVSPTAAPARTASARVSMNTMLPEKQAHAGPSIGAAQRSSDARQVANRPAGLAARRLARRYGPSATSPDGPAGITEAHISGGSGATSGSPLDATVGQKPPVHSFGDHQ